MKKFPELVGIDKRITKAHAGSVIPMVKEVLEVHVFPKTRELYCSRIVPQLPFSILSEVVKANERIKDA